MQHAQGGEGEMVGSIAPGPSNDVEISLRPARHLIVLLDGTGITASNLRVGTRHSNIYKINLALETHNDVSEAQIAFYIPGIGSSWTDQFPLTGVLGLGLIGDVEQAYINICSNYYPGVAGGWGDRIYLFGFSRGAVVARLLASLISKFGLLKASRLGRFADLWGVSIGDKAASSLGTLLSAGVHPNVFYRVSWTVRYCDWEVRWKLRGPSPRAFLWRRAATVAG
jgi:hypothetical protein